MIQKSVGDIIRSWHASRTKPTKVKVLSDTHYWLDIVRKHSKKLFDIFSAFQSYFVHIVSAQHPSRSIEVTSKKTNCIVNLTITYFPYFIVSGIVILLIVTIYPRVWHYKSIVVSQGRKQKTVFIIRASLQNRVQDCEFKSELCQKQIIRLI